MISDFSTRAATKTHSLLARNMDIYVIHVLSREEVGPAGRGDLRLVDAEDEDFAEIT